MPIKPSRKAQLKKGRVNWALDALQKPVTSSASTAEGRPERPRTSGTGEKLPEGDGSNARRSDPLQPAGEIFV